MPRIFVPRLHCCAVSVGLFLMTLALVMRSTVLSAAPKSWTGASSGSLSSPNNWSPAGAPAAGDDLIFQGPPVTRLLVTNDFRPNRAFRSLLFSGSNYVIRGQPMILTNGVISTNSVGTNYIETDVELRSSQAWEAKGALSVLAVKGDIELNAHTLTIRANTGDFLLNGVLSGSGNLVKTNVGTLRLQGAGHNTYSGFTRFDGGILELSKLALLTLDPLVFTNFIAIPGRLSVGDGNGLVGTDVLRLLADDQIADTSAVTIKNSGRFDLKGSSDRIGTLTMQGGSIQGAGGVLVLGGDVSVLSDLHPATIEGKLSLGGSTRTFDVAGGGAEPAMVLNANLSSDTTIFRSAGLVKTGPGMLWLGGTNSFNGQTIVNQGELALSADRALGTTTDTINGPAGTIINGTGRLFLANVQITNESLTLNSTASGGALRASGAAIWTGKINLPTDTFILSSNSLHLSGAILGTGGWTKLGAGSVTLSGTNVNSYSGLTTVLDGTLLLDKGPSPVLGGAMSGPLVIGEAELPTKTDVVRSLRCCQLPEDSRITINASGFLDLNGFGENVRELIFNGGAVDTDASGSIRPTERIVVNFSTLSEAVLSGRLSVLSNPVIEVIGHFFSPDLRIDAQIIGSGGFTKLGEGEIALTRSNSFTGAVTIRDGILEADHPFALGSPSAGTVITNRGTLAIRFNSHGGTEPLTLSGQGRENAGFGALHSSHGSNSWAGPLSVIGDSVISVYGENYLNLSGPISGAARLSKIGRGTLLLTGTSVGSFNALSIDAGTVVLAKSTTDSAGPAELFIGDGESSATLQWSRDNQLGDRTPIHVGYFGILDLTGRFDTVGTIDGRGMILLQDGSLRTGTDNRSGTFSGVINGGSGSLSKLGTGTWELSGPNRFWGQTTVSGGTLLIQGYHADGRVTVDEAATLGGNGIIGELHLRGTLRPGASPGMLTTSNLFLTPEADLFVDLAGPQPGTGYDQVNVRGTNNLGSATLHLSVANGFAPAEGEEFVILNNDGFEPIQGTFKGLPDGSLLADKGLQFRIGYPNLAHNDVVLTLVNTALRLVDVVVGGGNDNGMIDLGECNFLSVVLTNVSDSTLSGVTATLVPRTPGVSVTLPTSTYAALPSAGSGTNIALFRVSTSADLPCGKPLDFSLVVETGSAGTFSIPIQLPTPTGLPGPDYRFDNPTTTPIPHDDYVDIPILVSEITTSLQSVSVALHISHPSAQDLRLALIAPDGTRVELSHHNGGMAPDYGTDCDSDLTRTFFSDAGPRSIVGSPAPFVGTFRPEQPLSAFCGKKGSAVNGTWRLRVTDVTLFRVGQVHCWSLLLSTASCADNGGGCEACPEGVTVLGLVGPGCPQQNGRLFRGGIASDCSAYQPCQGELAPGVPHHYDAYVFEQGEGSACITATVTSDCGLFSAAYAGSFNPANLCQNHLADSGGSPGAPTVTYSFRVPEGARFVVVVSETAPDSGCAYTLRVTGGNCRPILRYTPLTEDRVDLDWSTAALGYNLERSEGIPSPPASDWMPFSSPPSIRGGRFHFIDTLSLPADKSTLPIAQAIAGTALRLSLRSGTRPLRFCPSHPKRTRSVERSNKALRMRPYFLTMNKSLWICLLAVSCSSSNPVRNKVDWSEFTEEQKTWPLALKASVDRPRDGVPVYRSAPLHPYDIIGSIRTSAGVGVASRVAKQHGADALLLELQAPPTNSVMQANAKDPQLFRAIRFTQAAALRQIQGHQAALDWLQQHPNGGTIGTANGAAVIESSRVDALREAWSAELARLRQFATTNNWSRPSTP